MFLFYVLSFFKSGDTIQGGTLYKGGHYLRKYGMYLILIFQDEEDLQPSASLASKTDTVFVSVNYRRGVLGFLSLQSLSDK